MRRRKEGEERGWEKEKGDEQEEKTREKRN